MRARSLARRINNLKRKGQRYKESDYYSIASDLTEPELNQIVKYVSHDSHAKETQVLGNPHLKNAAMLVLMERGIGL